MKKVENIAFIDGQNLHLGTLEDNWKVNLEKFRVYLKDKYKIRHAYYFLGVIEDNKQDLYDHLQKSGFIVRFKEHNQKLLTKKKGNVDSDIIFEIMKNLIDSSEDFEKIYLVSGDGDYKKIVDYLVKKERFGKILFPNKKFASSLYKELGNHFTDYLDKEEIRKKIEYIKH